ncbi:pyrophosphate--fructose 6-phosphate 1-phosphotransferase subunit alpha [Tanacetum coccineum]
MPSLVTRSIGDDDLKPGVTSELEITKTILSDDDEYLVDLILCRTKTTQSNQTYEIHRMMLPVTLNKDLKNQFVEGNVGFDTICKVNSQLISNVCTYALSTEKYYYFIRLIGRKASHVAVECTLQSHPNMVPWSNERPLENKELNAIIGA